MLKISSSGVSSAGQKSVNEDNFYMNGIFIADGNAREGGIYSDSKRRHMQFYAVFDGIGQDVESDINPNITFFDGQSSSFLSANIMSKLQQHIIKLRKSRRQYNLNDAVYKYVQRTNQQLFLNMQKKGIRSGVSFALLCIDGVKVHAYNIGNSKIFMLRESRLVLLTQNDTKVEDMIYAHQISQDIARYTPENKILTQYLGLHPNEKQAKLHINSKLTLQPGDKFLVCSDGLCDSISDQRILEIMLKDISEQETVRELLKEAEQNGMRENLSAIVVGANASDNLERVNILRARSAATPPHFKPLPMSHRAKFTVTPKMIKKLAAYGGILLAAVLVIVFVSRPIISWIDMSRPAPPILTDPDPPPPTTRAAAPPPTSPTPTTTAFSILPGEHDDGYDGYYGDITEPTTDPADLPPTTTAPPPTTPAPTTPAPTTPAPTTQPPPPEDEEPDDTAEPPDNGDENDGDTDENGENGDNDESDENGENGDDTGDVDDGSGIDEGNGEEEPPAEEVPAEIPPAGEEPGEPGAPETPGASNAQASNPSQITE